MKTIPYMNATSGQRALDQAKKILNQFGCDSFGVLEDQSKGETIVQFSLNGRVVVMKVSWKGYAELLIRKYPYNARRRQNKVAYEALLSKQAQISVCSVLRDWIKGQVLAVECGLLDFDTAFLPYLQLKDGRTVIDQVKQLELIK